MGLKREVVYRKAKKADFPAVIEFIRQKNLKGWECENEKTGKRLSRMLFYQYMSCRASFLVAVCREKVAGVIITGNGSRRRFAPLYKIKAACIFLRLKMTKEGRTNLKIIKQMEEMREELQDNASREDDFILFLYVHRNYLRNGIGSGLLKQLQEAGEKSYFIYADQKDSTGFLEKRGFVELAETERMMEINRQRFRETVFLYRYGKKKE